MSIRIKHKSLVATMFASNARQKTLLHSVRAVATVNVETQRALAVAPTTAQTRSVHTSLQHVNVCASRRVLHSYQAYSPAGTPQVGGAFYTVDGTATGPTRLFGNKVHRQIEHPQYHCHAMSVEYCPAD